LAGGSPSLLSVVLCFWPSLFLLSVFKIFFPTPVCFPSLFGSVSSLSVTALLLSSSPLLFLFSSVLPGLHSSQKQTPLLCFLFVCRPPLSPFSNRSSLLYFFSSSSLSVLFGFPPLSLTFVPCSFSKILPPGSFLSFSKKIVPLFVFSLLCIYSRRKRGAPYHCHGAG